MSIVLFGPPGAGKGTQSTLLVERSQLAHLSTGDLFRNAMKNLTPLGKKAKGFVDAGKLVPDEVTIGLVEEVVGQKPKVNYIFDGFPRTENQAEALEALVANTGAQPIRQAVFLEVSREVLKERLTGRRLCKNCGAVYHLAHNPSKEDGVCDLCGGELYQRKDDGEGVISTRLEAYDKSTAPLKAYYKKKGIYKEVDGLGSQDEVFNRIQGEIGLDS